MRHRFFASVLLCAACGAQASGQPVHVRWVLDSNVAGGNAEFETDTGFQVHLEQAQVKLAAAYLFAPTQPDQSPVAWLMRNLRSVAYAHGGLDVEHGQRVLAELTKSVELDALGGSIERLADTDAESGAVDAVKLQLADGVVAKLRGRAERAGRRWDFTAEVAPAEEVARYVELIGLSEKLSQDATVHLVVQPKTWLRLCDFSRLAPSGGSDEPSSVDADSQVGRALSIGVRSPDAFKVYITEPEAADAG